MNKILKIILYGFFIWLIPFLISIIIFPLKSSMNPLFESIMPVIITLVAVTFSYLYFNGVKENFIKEGIIIGVSWFVISIVIDLVLFLPSSPMQMSFADYLMDIGLTYVMIPVITVGMGYMAQNKAL